MHQSFQEKTSSLVSSFYINHVYSTQGVFEEVKDDYFRSKLKNADGEVVGTNHVLCRGKQTHNGR